MLVRCRHYLVFKFKVHQSYAFKFISLDCTSFGFSIYGSVKVPPVARICGPGVERSLLDPKVVGSNPGGAEIGLHDFHDPQK